MLHYFHQFLVRQRSIFLWLYFVPEKETSMYLNWRHQQSLLKLWSDLINFQTETRNIYNLLCQESRLPSEIYEHVPSSTDPVVNCGDSYCACNGKSWKCNSRFYSPYTHRLYLSSPTRSRKTFQGRDQGSQGEPVNRTFANLNITLFFKTINIIAVYMPRQWKKTI